MTVQCISNRCNKINLINNDEVSEGGLWTWKSVSSDIEGGAHALSGQNGGLTGPKLTIVVYKLYSESYHTVVQAQDYTF